MPLQTDLSKYNNSWFSPKAGFLKRLLWMKISWLFFEHSMAIGSGWKASILRLFGAKIGKGVVIKPSVQIKYPWLLSIGDYTWIGEKVWIDNLVQINIGKNACLSQGAMLLTGNHDFKKTTFDLTVKPIEIEDGVWIGAKAMVTQGVVCGSHSVLTVMSVASKNLEPYGIYAGIPAVKIKERIIEV
jgi:putative colanic acid biosynthesis acetyltransferase WcaF